MKALSMTRPWGTLAVLGEKKWETRPRRFHHVGIIAIHVSDGFPKILRNTYHGGLAEVCSLPFFKWALARHGYHCPDQLPVSAIIGFVECLRHARTDVVRAQLSEQELAFGLYADGRWAYQLANPQPISPVPCKGARGLWNVPKAIVERIVAENPSLVFDVPRTLPFTETSVALLS